MRAFASCSVAAASASATPPRAGSPALSTKACTVLVARGPATQPSTSCTRGPAPARALPETEVYEKTLTEFWAEQRDGELAEWQVERITRALMRSRVDGAFDPEWLEDRLESLASVLGGISPLPLVCADVEVLTVLSPADVADRLAQLAAALPEADVYEMACKQPLLLQTRGEAALKAKTEAALTRLTELYPYRGDLSEVPGVLEEYPQLILRLAFYPDARKVEELPVELQNCIFRNYCG